MESIPSDLESTWESLLRAGYSAESLARMLEQAEDAPSQAPIRALKLRLGITAENDSIERVIVALSAQDMLGRIPSLPVDRSVKKLLESDLRTLLTPSELMTAGSYNFDRASKLATGRRFPAGPMEWEISGIPRSWLFEARGTDFFRLIWWIAARLGGFRPCFFMHVAPKPRKRALVLEREVMRAYHRMAQSLALQPGIRGIIARAWFHDPQALAENPSLEPLNRPYIQHGGAVVLLGAADESSGVLEGNAERRAQYQQGRLGYRLGLGIWPRAEVLSWAEAHREYAD